jgi:two-component system sensor histidine kinase GlrK
VKVRTKLSGAFALYIALLAGLSYFHVSTIRRTVSSGRELADLAARVRVMSFVQLQRLALVTNDAEKYIIRRDTAYWNRVRQTLNDFDAELRGVDSARMSSRERALLAPLKTRWDSTLQLANTLGDKPDSAGVFALQSTLAPVYDATQALSAESQDAMTSELVASEKSEQKAQDLTIVVGCLAVILALALSALLARAILEPVANLTEGAREVSAGHFAHRIPTRGRDELAQVAQEFNAMTARLDELDRMKREFVSKVSHDLKTPLSSMQETHSVLLDEVAGPLTPKQRQLLEITQDSAARLSIMLNKLLDLSRLEAGGAAERQIVDMRPLVKRSVERLTEHNHSERVVVSLGDLGTRFFVSGDPDDLSQVVDNLLENALKFSPFDGPIRVRVSDYASRGDVPPEHWAALRQNGAVPGAVLVTVADEGPGVPNEEKERIFTRFYQTEAGRAVRSRGVGLGLSICQTIVQEHGGAIWVADNEPRGSIFNVLLPAAARVDHGDSSHPALTAHTANRS